MPDQASHRPQTSSSRCRQSGFTLTELILAIAVIVILTAILLPIAGKMRQKANTTADASNLRSIAIANQLYAQDNNGRSVVVFTPWRHPNPSRVWHLELRPYLQLGTGIEREGVMDVFLSPSDPTRGGLVAPETFPSAAPISANDWWRRSYNVNFNTRIYVGHGDYEGRPMIQMDPSQMLFVGNHYAIASASNGILPQSEESLRYIPRNWHGSEGGAQFAFLDGRVEMIQVNDLMIGGERYQAWTAYSFAP